MTIDRRYRRSRVRHAFGSLLVIAAGVTAALGGRLWWQDRPLREAEARLETGNPSAAIRAVDGYQREHGDDGRAQAIKARALVEMGRSAAAIELFEQYGAEDARELHAWAKALLMEQQWSAARPLLEHVLATGVDRADVLHELAACRMKLGDHSGAIEAAEAFCGIAEFEARGQLLLGSIQRERGNLRATCSAWERVLQLSPAAEALQVEPAEFLREFGAVALELGDPVRASELLERSGQLAADADTLAALGEAYAQRGLTERAESCWRNAIELAPGHESARNGLANLALSTGDARRAREWLRPLEHVPQLRSETAFQFQRVATLLEEPDEARRWGRHVEELRDMERAEQVASHLLRGSPESLWARVVRAYRFAESGNWIEAERLLRPVVPAGSEEPFIAQLADAVAVRGPLPPLRELPVRQF